MIRLPPRPPLFFFNDTATTEIYTLSLHDALPISTGLQAQTFDARESLASAYVRHGDVEKAIEQYAWLRKSAPSRYRSEEHTSKLQSPDHLVCRLLLEKKKKKKNQANQLS